MPEMLQPFAFVDGGRTFRCEADASRPLRGEVWWWFTVSTEANARHAPFRAQVTDTADAVRDRVLAFYDNLVARRAEPYQRTWSRGRPAAASTPTVAPATPA